MIRRFGIAAAKQAIYENATEEELASGAPLVAIALFAALEGRTDDAVTAIRQWRQGIGTDWAGRERHHAVL